jgi:hypothetical protein
MMRNVWGYRFILALVVPLLVAVMIFSLFIRNGSTKDEETVVQHFVNYTASVATVQADEGWLIDSGITVATARIALDDGRALYIPSATPGEIECVEFTTPNACVLVAELLGDAAVWFALTPAAGKTPLTRLPLSPIVDMLEGGDYAVLKNDWIIPLATPTKRDCDTATASLREFIDKYGDTMEVSLNLVTDEIDIVRCPK